MRTTRAPALLAILTVGLVTLAVPTASSGTTPIVTTARTVPLESCRAGRVALTFDDGPSPTVTPRLVALLTRLDVPATFFMVGSRVAAYPDVARQVADAGFTIGNHTWDHADLTSLSDREVKREIRRTRRALKSAGITPSSFVRPPYGAADTRVRDLIRSMRLTPAFWTVDSRDWDGLSKRDIRRTTVAQVRDRGHRGSVVLHHDGVANSPATLAALPREIGRLRRDGYCFVDLATAPAGTW